MRRGDSGAFEVLYDRHAAALLSFCFFILGSREDAEDAVQSTFAAAYRALLRDEREIEARPWLYAIARNACFGILRKRRPQDSAQLAQIAGEDMVVQVEQRERLRELLAAMLELPERHRTALVLAELHGHSQREIGLLLDVSPGTVKSYIFQARTALASERNAREADCEEIRAELASARGAALLRGPLRRHLRACEGCSEYASQIARRRRELGALLPLPSLVLRRRVLDATAGKTGSAGALGGASAGAGGAGATLTGGSELGGVGVKALLVKALVLAAGLGASAGAGTVVLSITSSQPALSTARASSSLADAAWREPEASLARTASEDPLATPSASRSALAGVSQPAFGQLRAVESLHAKQAAYDGPYDTAARGGERSSDSGKGSGIEHGKAGEHGRSAEHGNSAEHGKSGAEHGKSAEHGSSGEVHVAKGASAEHAHAAHGKPGEPGKPSAHVDQGARGKAVRHESSPRADVGKALGRPVAGYVEPPDGSASQSVVGSQGAGGAAGGGSTVSHGGSASVLTTEASPNGHVEAPSSPAPAASAHGHQDEAAHGPLPSHEAAKG